MTHDELMAIVDDYDIGVSNGMVRKESVYAVAKVFRAIVELHKPYYSNFVDESLHSDDGGLCFGCMNSTGDEPPAWEDCPTIQAIEEQLK